VKTSRLPILPIAVCSLFLATAVSGQTPAADSTLTVNPVFEKNCAKCHGKTAEGRHLRGPSLVSEKVTSVPDGDLRHAIANGKGHMPKFTGKLTAEEIDTLVQQIKSSKSKP
jgi:mono/diheme cytochrome c family protein